MLQYFIKYAIIFYKKGGINMGSSNTIGGLHYEMMRRCYNPKSIAFKQYGAKGIRVCKEWHDKENFKKWCEENGYIKGIRIDRLDSEKDYCPENCTLGYKSTRKQESEPFRKRKRRKIAQLKKEQGIYKKCTKDRLYKIWVDMQDRCFNPNNIYHSYYGGRGITVCDEWLGKCGYINFYKWARENGYSLNLTIDRIDSNGNYEPSNCRWATMKQQGRNKRNNRLIMYKGSEITIAEASERLDIPYSYIYYRIIKGKSLDEIIEMYKLSKIS